MNLELDKISGDVVRVMARMELLENRVDGLSDQFRALKRSVPSPEGVYVKPGDLVAYETGAERIVATPEKAGWLQGLLTTWERIGGKYHLVTGAFDGWTKNGKPILGYEETK